MTSSPTLLTILTMLDKKLDKRIFSRGIMDGEARALGDRSTGDGEDPEGEEGHPEGV